ncbi:hypothetical protein C1X73_25240 [Pseudomonas sp. FW305-130]|nr:hypothetical protein C1X74_24855 [Pseudomonas sp. GW460-5]PNB54782.1 hypothetical protein C1X73_25240 [Pseudomonas sp. FW305-130]
MLPSEPIRLPRLGPSAVVSGARAVFVVVPVVVGAARRFGQPVSHLAVLDAINGVVTAWLALGALVQHDSDVIVVFQELGCSFAALGLLDLALSNPFLVAVIVAPSFLHACAVLRGRMQHGGNLKSDAL